MPATAFEPVVPCSCPEVPPEQRQQQPTRDQVIGAMVMVKDEVGQCFEEEGSLAVKITIEGVSGHVTRVELLTGSDSVREACVRRALRLTCFPRFRREVFMVIFPFESTVTRAAFPFEPTKTGDRLAQCTPPGSPPSTD
jgi:hypothetical protein